MMPIRYNCLREFSQLWLVNNISQLPYKQWEGLLFPLQKVLDAFEMSHEVLQ